MHITIKIHEGAVAYWAHQNYWDVKVFLPVI